MKGLAVKKTVYLETEQWKLVDSLLHAATAFIAKDVERERVTALEPSSKEALIWSNEQIAAIRVIISPVVFEMPAVCDCADICKIPAGQPQPIASCRGLENQTTSPAAVQRLYDALSAMMYGWEDDAVRVEAFAALKATDDWLAAQTTTTSE